MTHIEEWLFGRVEMDPNGGCWLWALSLDHEGYGRVAAGMTNRQARAHRHVWGLINGPVPKDLVVLHRCDVRCCVNPDHLSLGTASDNMRDMFNKGRQGVRSRYRRTSAEQARRIISLSRSGMSSNKIADDMGFGQTRVRRIIRKARAAASTQKTGGEG